MMKWNTLLFICCCVLQVSAQKEQYNWFFGRQAALSFNSGQALVNFSNPQIILGPSASYSDPVTGSLLFYSDGNRVWNSSHQVMSGGAISTGNKRDVMIAPVPRQTTQYYLFFTDFDGVKYVVVDMDPSTPGGKVVNPVPTILMGNAGPTHITLVRHPYTAGFWVLIHPLNTNQITGYLVDQSGFNFSLVVEVGLPPEAIGDWVANPEGTKLALTHYMGNNNVVEVFDFDPVCGKISNPVVLPKDPGWDYAYGAAFSPDGKILYISYSFTESQLVQYSGTNFQQRTLIATAPDNMNVIRVGPDERLYIATHDGGNPGPRIGRVANPNSLGIQCAYKKTYASVDNGSGRLAYFELPAYMMGKHRFNPIRDSLVKVNPVCLGQTTQLKFNTQFLVDSIQWKLGANGTFVSTQKEISYVFPTEGKHPFQLTIYRCGKSYVMDDTVRIAPVPKINFPTDTVLCSGLRLKLTAPASDRYRWSTGDTQQSITTQQPDKIWLRAYNGDCWAADTIVLKYYPSIQTLLGDDYFICDDDKELVKLDAGEKFVQYKWTPTGDTTQWIVVGDVGPYFVVVKDFRGCKGEDGTRVERRCPVSVYYPNAFTPNNDGTNDVFMPVGNDVVEFAIQIFNGWGQKVFESKDLSKGWDGKLNGEYAPVGTYMYQSTYSGYRNKKPVTFEVKGNIMLLR